MVVQASDLKAEVCSIKCIYWKKQQDIRLLFLEQLHVLKILVRNDRALPIGITILPASVYLYRQLVLFLKTLAQFTKIPYLLLGTTLKVHFISLIIMM